VILAVHTEASYLLEQNGKSRASAHFYLTNHDDEEFNSGAILRLSSIIKHMSSASKVELHHVNRSAGKTSPQNSLAQSTRSKTTIARPNCTTELTTINQEMVLACIGTYVKVTQTPLQPARLTQQKIPIKMLNAVLKNNIGKLMEMCHQLGNPKCTKLWGKLYTKELG
jgi:hypothetical protein